MHHQSYDQKKPHRYKITSSVFEISHLKSYSKKIPRIRREHRILYCSMYLWNLAVSQVCLLCRDSCSISLERRQCCCDSHHAFISNEIKIHCLPLLILNSKVGLISQFTILQKNFFVHARTYIWLVRKRVLFIWDFKIFEELCAIISPFSWVF